MGHGREALGFCWDRWWMGNASNGYEPCVIKHQNIEERPRLCLKNRDACKCRLLVLIGSNISPEQFHQIVEMAVSF